MTRSLWQRTLATGASIIGVGLVGSIVLASTPAGSALASRLTAARSAPAPALQVSVVGGQAALGSSVSAASMTSRTSCVSYGSADSRVSDGCGVIQVAQDGRDDVARLALTIHDTDRTVAARDIHSYVFWGDSALGGQSVNVAGARPNFSATAFHHFKHDGTYNVAVSVSAPHNVFLYSQFAVMVVNSDPVQVVSYYQGSKKNVRLFFTVFNETRTGDAGMAVNVNWNDGTSEPVVMTGHNPYYWNSNPLTHAFKHAGAHVIRIRVRTNDGQDVSRNITVTTSK